ncbi:ISAs1 family transposase [Spartinivicinus marinus]|nr:ISAs1 family transposase [Spartinivicinus marinus]MCX4025040.1 ISAs1 family transposase [Spartinivicinus marinus]MCX4025868.1 ISAs1 family transposase [Spartinivicinus marinus]MCX4027380.1 ISAs1 family transposase [Spartinivicinus marinus]MCX4027587.1 ISAs1 family transposase [Spartinivicinus marinus]MCX4028400.1 ISAs1 family transposase [Spartinivicinus marinus]
MVKNSTVLDHFEQLDDPRMERRRRHKLIDIITITICAALCGADDWVAIERFGNAKEAWFKSFLELPNGIPSHDTFGRFFSRLCPTSFQSCFIQWVQSITDSLPGKLVAIDGKTLRRSFTEPDKKNAIHLVNAWSIENKLVLGQLKTDIKSNEITAIPELLEAIAVKGAVVSIDAMGCHKAIAKKIREKGAHYLLAVKNNQRRLYSAIQEQLYSKKAKVYQRPAIDFHSSEKEQHGRHEIRRCWVYHSVAKLPIATEWIDLAAVIRVETERTLQGKKSKEQRYYISSQPLSAKAVSEMIQHHWQIENSLHWSLDVAFREDDSRIRIGHSAENMSRIRQIALNILKQDDTYKIGIKNKRLSAGWDHEYLMKLICSV